MPTRVLIWFSAVHLSSSIPRSPQCAAAAPEDDDGGGYLQLNEVRKGSKCCSPAVVTCSTGTIVERAPQPHARGWEGKKEKGPSVCLTPCHATRVEPQRALRQLTASLKHQENCAPLRYSLMSTSKAANFC